MGIQDKIGQNGSQPVNHGETIFVGLAKKHAKTSVNNGF